MLPGQIFNVTICQMCTTRYALNQLMCITNNECLILKNSLIIHEENTKKNHKRVVSVYVIQIHVDLHKLKL